MLKKLALLLWVVCPLALSTAAGCGGSQEAVEIKGGEYPAEEAAKEAAEMEAELNDPATIGGGAGCGDEQEAAY